MENANETLASADIKGLKAIPGKVWDYLTSAELWELIMLASIKILGILIVAYLAVFIGKRVIANVFYLSMRTPLNHSERRQKTILKLLQSVLSYIVYFSAILAVLSVLEINVAGLLAGAGIAGLAIGFGAQSLVKDIISGFFIIFEDQFGVGDHIKLNAAEGTVVEIGLRTTKVRGSSGEQHTIPNGSIGVVVNYSVNDTSTFVDFDIPVTKNIDEVERKVKQYLNTLPEQYKELTKTPLLMGVQNFTHTDATIRIKVETVSMQHSKMARIIRKDLLLLLEEFDVKMDSGES
jgi:moderate conductance mechanosensitive channel